MENNNEEYFYSDNEECFRSGGYGSREEALESGMKDLGDNCTVFIGKKVELNKEWMYRRLRCVDIELIAENMMCEVGEVAEDWLRDINEDELNEIVIDYLIKKDKPSFCLIDDVKEYST